MGIGSFSAGLSGLSANAVFLNVVGNNLANVNTVGFKYGSVSFNDLVGQTVNGSSGAQNQVGLGVIVQAVSPVFSQGTIETTREATNVAIQGGGLFVVRSPAGQAYTRAGNFTIDSQGVLVTPDGHRVQGYTSVDPATGDIITTGQPTDITVPPGVLRQPTATTTFRTLTNLDSATAAGGMFTASVQLYDGLGAPHLATITYTKAAAAGLWDYQITLPGAEVTGGVAGTPFLIGTGQVQFDALGKLASVTAAGGAAGGGTPAADVNLTTPGWANGAAPSVLTWDLVDAGAGAALTGFASPSATSSINQNGAAPGIIDHINIEPDGTISGAVSSGQTVALGKLALASFNNPKGLMKLGSNRYGETQASGIANIGEAGTGGRGTLIGSALEMSNVDLAEEFTKMILAQRGYQASSKTITVSDELLVDTLNLKR